MWYKLADKAVSGFEAIAYAIARRRQARPVHRKEEAPYGYYPNGMPRTYRTNNYRNRLRAEAARAPEIKTYKAKR